MKKAINRQISIKKYTNDNRRSLTARVKQEDLPIINQRLKLYGFSSINEIVHDFIKGKFPQITEDRQIENLINNTQSNGLKSILEGGNNREFYEFCFVNYPRINTWVRFPYPSAAKSIPSSHPPPLPSQQYNKGYAAPCPSDTKSGMEIWIKKVPF